VKSVGHHSNRFTLPSCKQALRLWRFPGAIQIHYHLQMLAKRRTHNVLEKYLHAWPWFTWKLFYFTEIRGRLKMTCGMSDSLLRLNISLVLWLLGNHSDKSYMLIQNTDVFVTGRENESLSKYPHTYCMSWLCQISTNSSALVHFCFRAQPSARRKESES